MKYNDLNSLFKGICDAIRKKDGTTALISHQDIPDRIMNLSGVGTDILHIIPKCMKSMVGQYDHTIGHYKIMFDAPDDTITTDGQVVTIIEKVIIRRKLGEEPVDEIDGTLVATISRPSFERYKNDWYTDAFFTPQDGDTWYYKAFPVNSFGYVNTQPDNSTGGMAAKDYFLYGFEIDESKTEPSEMVNKLDDNAKFRNAFMDFAAGKFSYGSWKDAFFMPRPCMLNFDGTVAYYLDPNDEGLKEDGTPSDVANESFEANAMMEWPVIWWKKRGESGYSVSDKQVDSEFKCWSNIDANGDEIANFYTPIYEGCVINGRLRSLSGKNQTLSLTRQQELEYAWAYNSENMHMYDTEVMCDIQLFRILCVLISGTTNSQNAFGNGAMSSLQRVTGTLNKKGMFFGASSQNVCVKVFGMENPWGNLWHNVAGWVNDKGTQKVKMTYGTSDGSTVDGYNVTGDGYIAVQDATPSGSNGGYTSSCKFTEHGIIPKAAYGSETKKYCDTLYYNNNNVCYALIGGGILGYRIGLLSTALDRSYSENSDTRNARISCKPLASIQGKTA